MLAQKNVSECVNKCIRKNLALFLMHAFNYIIMYLIFSASCVIN